MALFQQSVLKKYLADLPKLEVEAAFQRLTAHFGNPDIQENIRNAKEEQYQEGFLRELFVTVLGFTLHPQPNFNLITEQKNEKNSKKADGAILRQDKVIAVIELKSLKTTDLQSIELQAFGYKNNQAHCIYVLTSNFQKLRFYIENAIDFEEFDLFNLSKERFEILYLCLNYNNLLSDLPLRLKKASLQQEENITKKLYKDYSNFKQALFADVSARNRQHDKLLLYKKTQKLLDRFLFLFFAEDKGLLPPNTVQIILNQWEELKELDEYVPLYQRFQRFFGYLNVGHKSKHFEIFAYNGGLFAPDAVLDSLVVADNLLYNHSRILSHYDFDTEVDTNILGHIFEHSLNELDEITALTEGGSFDKSKTKRKKDGIFYTPRYITKYIVAQTVGELCRRKQHEIGLNPNEISRATSKKVRDTEFKKINTYREWLLSITILDPACGSGAFLNEALSFLIDEHRLIDAMTATLFGDAMTLTDNVIQILENNIFGVDINEESVEIARLSLWLRTAKIGRKLNDLSKNIKVGNSLISDPSVAGDLAFEWQREFPQVFQKGGFDIVIGNPPYVDMRGIKNEDIAYIKKSFSTASNRINLFGIFLEKAYTLINEFGECGMIIHRNLIRSNEYEKCRELILEKTTLRHILSFQNGVFKDVTGEMSVIIFSKTSDPKINNTIQVFNYESFINYNVSCTLIPQYFFKKSIGKRFNVYLNEDKVKLLEKLTQNSLPFGKIAETLQGIIAGDEKKFIISNKLSEVYQPIIRGKDIKRYTSFSSYEYINYADEGKILTRGRKKENFEVKEKILTQHISGGINAMLDTKGLYYMQTVNGSIIKDSKYSAKYILGLLNSKLMQFYYDNVFNIGAEFTTAVAIENLDLLPIRIIDNATHESIINKVNEIVLLKDNNTLIENDFIKLLQVSFSGLKLTKKLENWYELTFSDLRKELEKQQLNIPLKERLEWQTEFEGQQTALLALRTQIHATDAAIDRLVYALYDLTQEEIALVEGVPVE